MDPYPPGRRARPLIALVLLAVLGACASTSEPTIEDPGQVRAAVPAEQASPVADVTGAAPLRAADLRRAYEHFKARVDANSGDAAAHLGLGEVYLASDRPGLALEAFRVAAAAPDLAPAARQGQGLAHWRLGNVDGAIEHLSEAVDADPGLWRAWNALGAAHDVKRNWPAASTAYERALALQPDQALLHNNLGASYLLQDQLPEAIVAFERALQLDPALATAENNLRLALALQGRYVEALQGTEQGARARALNNAGYAALLRGDLSMAESLLRQALELSPMYYDRAARNLERVAAMQPTP